MMPETAETFTAVEFDSFDEGRKEVDKAIRDRKIEIKAEKEHAHRQSIGISEPVTPSSNTTAYVQPAVVAPAIDNLQK